MRKMFSTPIYTISYRAYIKSHHKSQRNYFFLVLYLFFILMKDKMCTVYFFFSSYYYIFGHKPRLFGRSDNLEGK